MAIHTILSPKYRLLTLSLLISVGGSAQAASFDCQKAGTETERAICADSVLSDHDQAIAENYQQLITTLPAEKKSVLLNTQRNWLKQRNACGNNTACLTQQLTQRDNDLNSQRQQAQSELDTIIAGIATTPAQSAAQLRHYNNLLSDAWQVYLHQFVPSSGVTPQEAQRAEHAATAALETQDSFAASLLQDIGKDPKTTRSEAVLTLLRMAIEHSNYDRDSRPYVHCFVFARQEEEAYQAFGPLYGSSRDGAAPICPPQGGLFKQDTWRKLRNQFAAPENTVGVNAGTIRFASYATWNILELQATLSPQMFLKAGQNTDQTDDPVQRIRDWADERVWPEAQRQVTLDAIPPVQQATRRWLQLERGFSATDAPVAAENIVHQWLNQHLDYLEENSDNE